MMYGPDKISAMSRAGRRACFDFKYDLGRDRDVHRRLQGRETGWKVSIRHARKPAFAYTTTRKQQTVHAVRYRIRAVHERTGAVETLTQWWCGGYTCSDTETVKEPSEVCRTCLNRNPELVEALKDFSIQQFKARFAYVSNGSIFVKCKVCGARGISGGRWQAPHWGDHPHQCNGCEKKFVTRMALANHTRLTQDQAHDLNQPTLF